MIELEPIKQIKSPSSENVIIFALRCINYMIINDKLNGLIVLDLEWSVNDTLRMYKNDDIRMYNFNCITDTIVEVITTCNTYTLLTVHLL